MMSGIKVSVIASEEQNGRQIEIGNQGNENIFSFGN